MKGRWKERERRGIRDGMPGDAGGMKEGGGKRRGEKKGIYEETQPYFSLPSISDLRGKDKI